MANSDDNVQKAHQRIDDLKDNSNMKFTNLEHSISELSAIAAANALAINKIQTSMDRIEQRLFIGSNGATSISTEMELIRLKLGEIEKEQAAKRLDKKTIIAIGLGVVGFSFQAMRLLAQLVQMFIDGGAGK